MDYFDKILGALIGGAAGDAMGAATEARTPKQIIDIFGHEVRSFEKPPSNAIGAGNEPGQVTDDFSCAYFIAQEIVNNGGKVTQQCVEKAILFWSEHKVFFDRFVGPTTKLAIMRFKGEELKDESGYVNAKNPNWQATNGAGMRISPIGMLNPGNIDKAIEEAIIVTMPTHGNQLAISGACAVAAAVSRAMMPDADLYNVLLAGMYGAKKGEELGKERANIVAGASVVCRMEMAIDIGLKKGGVRSKITDIANKIGSGLHIAEAVPAAFGALAACDGMACETIIAAVNMGYDTDTVATMAGAIAGGMRGQSAFPSDWLPLLERVNGLDISGLAKKIEEVGMNV